MTAVLTDAALARWTYEAARMMGASPELAEEAELEFYRERAAQTAATDATAPDVIPCRGCAVLIPARGKTGQRREFCAECCRERHRYHESRPGARVNNPRRKP